jgi:hypothetical protein
MATRFHCHYDLWTKIARPNRTLAVLLPAVPVFTKKLWDTGEGANQLKRSSILATTLVALGIQSFSTWETLTIKKGTSSLERLTAKDGLSRIDASSWLGRVKRVRLVTSLALERITENIILGKINPKKESDRIREFYRPLIPHSSRNLFKTFKFWFWHSEDRLARQCFWPKHKKFNLVSGQELLQALKSF